MLDEPLELSSNELEFLDTEFNIIMNRDQLRGEVVSRLSGKNALIANPGEQYNDTDLVDFKYPSRMILFAGESNNMTFVHYMQGGFAPHPMLYIAKFKDRNIIFECSYVLSKASNLEELKSIFKTSAQRTKPR